MRKRLDVRGPLALLLALAGCSSSTNIATNPAPPAASSPASDSDIPVNVPGLNLGYEEALRRTAYDPDSVRFRDTWQAPSDPVRHGSAIIICGEINGRNGFGGYAGFRRFVAIGRGNNYSDWAVYPVELPDHPDLTVSAELAAHCTTIQGPDGQWRPAPGGHPAPVAPVISYQASPVVPPSPPTSPSRPQPEISESAPTSTPGLTFQPEESDNTNSSTSGEDDQAKDSCACKQYEHAT